MFHDFLYYLPPDGGFLIHDDFCSIPIRVTFVPLDFALRCFLIAVLALSVSVSAQPMLPFSVPYCVLGSSSCHLSYSPVVFFLGCISWFPFTEVHTGVLHVASCLPASSLFALRVLMKA